MDELRWILLGLGVLIVIGVYGYARLQDWRRDGAPWSRRSAQREPFADEDPVVDDDDPIIGATTVRFDPSLEPEPQPDVELSTEQPAEQAPAQAAPEPVSEPQPQAPSEPELDLPPPPDEPEAVSDEEKIVALSVMAPSDQPYNGGDLRNALIGAGLKLTDQGVFRRGLDTHDGTVALFSVANIVEPGVFSSATLDHDQVPGVVFIMQLPGPFDGLSTFEQMLTTAQRLTQRLGGQVLDGRRCDLTGQAIEHIREELIEYRRRAKLASRRGG